MCLSNSQGLQEALSVKRGKYSYRKLTQALYLLGKLQQRRYLRWANQAWRQSVAKGLDKVAKGAACANALLHVSPGGC